MATALTIVDLLADRSPLAASEICGDIYCTLCSATEPSATDLTKTSSHDSDCPWRLAKEGPDA